MSFIKNLFILKGNKYLFQHFVAYQYVKPLLSESWGCPSFFFPIESCIATWRSQKLYFEGTWTRRQINGSISNSSKHFIIEAGYLVSEYFSALERLGMIRLRESPYYRPELQLEKFMSALQELFPAKEHRNPQIQWFWSKTSATLWSLWET